MAKLCPKLFYHGGSYIFIASQLPYVIIPPHIKYAFQSESTLLLLPEYQNPLLKTGAISEVSVNANTRPFSQTEPTTELCWKGWFVWCIWLYVLVISRTRFRVNPNSVSVWCIWPYVFLPCHVRVLEWTEFKHFTFLRLILLTSEHQGVGVGILLKK